jgi:hypothetical protein
LRELKNRNSVRHEAGLPVVKVVQSSMSEISDVGGEKILQRGGEALLKVFARR